MSRPMAGRSDFGEARNDPLRRFKEQQGHRGVRTAVGRKSLAPQSLISTFRQNFDEVSHRLTDEWHVCLSPGRHIHILYDVHS